MNGCSATKDGCMNNLNYVEFQKASKIYIYT